MHYYEWNNLIGKLLFNSSKAGQQVLLYLTREDITRAALNAGCFETEDKAWTSFSRSPRRWFGSTKNLIECITDSLTRSQQITIGGVVHKTEYPVCLTLLVQSVMPLIDGGELVSQSDYYNRAAEYAHQHGFAPIITNNANQNWNAAWQQIQHWSATIKNSQLGRFALNDSFGHIYVGKPFSQCLIPPQAIRDLPRAFVRAGWVPRQPLTQQHWQTLLTSHSHDLGFRQAALKTLRTGDGLNYAQAILQERFDQWDGTTRTAALANGVNKQRNGTARRTQVSKEDTLARFYLTFSVLDDTEGRFEWCYRIRSSQTMPDVVNVDDQSFAGQLGGWSSAVAGSFEEGKQGYDAVNKWKIKWPDSSIRLFDRGQWHGLSSRVWVEVNELSRVNKMWAICRPDQKVIMRQWGTTFSAGQFNEYVPNEDFDATNWPAGYGLFGFEHPTQGIPKTGYTLSATKQLRFGGGLEVRFGVYDDRHRPTLQIINGDGTEVVTAFTETGQQVTLDVHPENPTLYTFVGNVTQQAISCPFSSRISK